MPEEATIHVVDDDEPFQTAMTRLLRAVGYRVRAYLNAGDFLLARLDDGPGCILLDMRMPGPSGLDLQRALASRESPLPIIFLSGFGDVPSAVQAIKAGAADFLTKPVKRETLLAAIERALAGETSQRIVRQQLQRWRSCYLTLTARELSVFAGVVAGKPNKQIAGEMDAGERTVKAHRAVVMHKMCAGSVAELVHIADQLHPKLGAPDPRPPSRPAQA